MHTHESPGADIRRYRITVQGHLDEAWSSSFDGLVIATGFEGDTPVTNLTGSFADQAALSGVLGRLQGMGLKLLSLNQAE